MKGGNKIFNIMLFVSFVRSPPFFRNELSVFFIFLGLSVLLSHVFVSFIYLFI